MTKLFLLYYYCWIYRVQKSLNFLYFNNEKFKLFVVFLQLVFCTEDMINRSLWEAVNTKQSNLEASKVRFLSGLVVDSDHRKEMN